MRIRTKLLVPFLALPLGSLGVLGFLAYRNGRQAIETSLGRLFELEAVRGIEALDHEVLALYRSGEAWTVLDPMQDVLTDDMDGRISSFLVARARAQPSLRRAVVTDVAGRVVAASHRESLGTSLGSMPPPGLDPLEACVDESGPGADSTLTCSFPIRAHFDERQVLGTLSLAWELAPIFERLHADRRLAPVQAELVLLRRDGRVVAAPASRRPWMQQGGLLAAGSRAAALAGSGHRGFLVETLGGAPSLVGHAHSTGPTGWSVLVVETTAVAFAPVERLRVAVLGVGGAVALVAFVASLLGSARLTRPIRELEAAARRVAAGDLSVRILARSGDEIDSLSSSFDQMVQDLARQRTQLVDKQYVDALIAGMSDGLFVLDPAGRVQRANPAFLRMIGMKEDAVIGWQAGALFAEGETVLQERVLKPTLRQGSATEVELDLYTADGAIPVIVSAGRLPLAGPADIVCIATDISHRKTAEVELQRAREAAEAAAQAKARFLAAVSHEVRTPLNGILGVTDLLAGTRLGEKQREYVDTARRSSEALLALLSDILDYSRMDAGRLELARVAFDLRECVEDAAAVLAASARDKDLELSVHVDEGLARRVVGDPNRVRQVLLNLGSNAVKFTDAGGVVIRAERVAGSPTTVAFSVVDTGIGIPAPQHERIFEPFHQVDASSTRRHGGVGLGLAIVRQLVGLMGGSISVRSEEGRGATFIFTAELPPVAEERRPTDRSPEALVGLRVLVVDDNATNRLVVREMLQSWRCVVEEAVDAWEGLEKLRAAVGTSRELQLALVDFQMPEMDGASLAREIKADARLARLPLVLLTSIPQHAEVAQAMSETFAACLTKPIRQSGLLETILDVLSGAETSPRRPRLSLVNRRDRDDKAPSSR